MKIHTRDLGPQSSTNPKPRDAGAGKGDVPRPKQVDVQTYRDNWERTFGSSSSSAETSSE